MNVTRNAWEDTMARQPKVYYSTHTDANGEETWGLIRNGLPVCRTMRTIAEASKAAEFWGIIPAHVWYGDTGVFRPLNES